MPSSPTWPCPMKVYAYAGFYEEEGIPYVYSEEDEADEMYQDAIVSGRPEYSFNEEDGPMSAGGASIVNLPNLPHVPGDPNSGASGGTLVLDGDWLWGNAGRLAFGYEYTADGPQWKKTWCWPEQCAPGLQWKHRNMIPPAGRADHWVEYVRIPVKFDEDLPASSKAVFRDAAEMIRKATCIIFEEEDLFENEPLKYVSVGRTAGSLEDYCNVTGLGLPPDPYTVNRLNMGSCHKPNHIGSILHELMHILGVGDATSRPDATTAYYGRGPYITPKWSNIPLWDKPKFTVDYLSYVGAQRERRWQDPLVKNPFFGYAPYDFQSVMHVGNIMEEFITDPMKWNDKVGQRSRLSEGDIICSMTSTGVNISIMTGREPAAQRPQLTLLRKFHLLSREWVVVVMPAALQAPQPQAPQGLLQLQPQLPWTPRCKRRWIQWVTFLGGSGHSL